MTDIRPLFLISTGRNFETELKDMNRKISLADQGFDMLIPKGVVFGLLLLLFTTVGFFFYVGGRDATPAEAITIILLAAVGAAITFSLPAYFIERHTKARNQKIATPAYRLHFRFLQLVQRTNEAINNFNPLLKENWLKGDCANHARLLSAIFINLIENRTLLSELQAKLLKDEPVPDLAEKIEYMEKDFTADYALQAFKF
jgi:hypothetical protein